MARHRLVRPLSVVVSVSLVAGLVSMTIADDDRPPDVHVAATDDDRPEPTAEVSVTGTAVPPTTMEPSAPTTSVVTIAPPPRPRVPAPATPAPSATALPTHGPGRPLGTGGLYIVDAADGARRRIVAANNITDVEWSPNGDQISYVADQRVWVINADGSGSRALTAPSPLTLRPQWSPSGKLLAYVTAGLQDPGELKVTDVSTGNTRVVEAGMSSMMANHAWAPAGEVLAYTDGSATLVAHDLARGRRSQLLTQVSGGPLAWSGDGETLAFRAVFGPNTVIAMAQLNWTAEIDTDFRPVYAGHHGFEDPVWLGDRFYYIEPFTLWSVTPAGEYTGLVADYTSALDAGVGRPDTLFIITSFGSVPSRRIERLRTDGSGRSVVMPALPGHAIMRMAAAPSGDRLAAFVSHWENPGG